jgi:hypothetical protein
MNTGFTVGLAVIFIVGLFVLLRYIRNRNREAEAAHARLVANTRERNRKTWDDLTNYPDVRIPRPRVARKQKAQSYFDFTSKSVKD